jgi:parvulin-like peptidyl-prolyl isomerase
LDGLVQFEKRRAEAPPAAAPSASAVAAAAKPALRPLPSAARAEDPADRETVEASHLLVAYQGSRRAAPTVTRTKEEAKKRAEEALAKAKKKGAEFEKVVAEYSDEPRAAERGGKLGAFTRRRMAKEFSDAAFALKPGEISGIVETPFGYHVILRTK